MCVAADSLCVGVGVGAGTGVPLSVLLVAKVLGAKQNFNSWPLPNLVTFPSSANNGHDNLFIFGHTIPCTTSAYHTIVRVWG